MQDTWFLIRWLWYLTRLVLWLLYSVLNFVSKPATRRLVPVLIVIATALCWSIIKTEVEASSPQEPQDYVLGYGTIAGAIVLICIAYLIASRVLAMVLSVFPPIRRPLRPVARLVVAAVKDRPVPVRIVVPPLR